MRAGKVAGVQLILNNWFLLLMALFAAAGMLGKALVVFVAVLWHETAHALVAHQLGYRVREIELLPFGGVARIDRLGEAAAASELWIAAAGPLSSLVVAGLLAMGRTAWPAWAEELTFCLHVNLTLATFNLLPALPLDGGRILRALLSKGRDYGQATAAVVRLGKLISLGLVAAVAFDYFVHQSINLTFLIAAVFLYAAAKAETSAASFRIMRVLAGKKAELTARGVLPTVHFTAVAGAAARDVVRLFGPEQYHIVLIVDDTFRLRGALTETEVWEALPEHGMYAKIGDFLS
ncbi:M50 family metallopeptidase [Sporolituus thermophilus]|uniref:Stage IV sporulation protein FB n=1 Tax=Sporolituus thermophilus DSM 23256 TaxID=1123285 RepID=A0A1G7J9C5_9FIRM|nr:M50 family metallopeptidase [Sporolituus thermophilus]SDF21384.1 stage IV sporulation protein FB [Sporolituus thermophilus DSM 23256]